MISDKKNENNKLNINFELIKNNNILNCDLIDNKKFIKIMDPEKSVVFINYENNCQTCSQKNIYEVNIIKNLLLYLKKVNYDLDKIGVITPYRNQQNLLRKDFESLNFKNIYTIDGSQGSEKEMIIVSFVITKTDKFFIDDKSRINVAFTRAQRKLIIIGVKNALQGLDNFQKYMREIEDNHYLFELKLGEFI